MNNPIYNPGLPCAECGRPTFSCRQDLCHDCRRHRKAKRDEELADIRRDQIKDGEE